MAEGYAQHFHPQYRFYSAGIKKHGLNQHAVTVMKEEGIDISSHASQTLDEFAGIKFDYVFTVCGHAHETCPYLPNAKIIHKGFDDPPYLTREIENIDEILPVYRKVRDEIKDFIQNIKSFF